MKKSTFERILQVTAVLTIIIIFIFRLSGINIFSKEGVIKIPTIISIVVIFWAFYLGIGWKWPLIKYIVYQENLNGTWFGKYNSKNFTSDEVFVGDIAIVIKQSFLRIDVKSYTEHYINYSFGEALKYDSKSDTNQLIYLYSQSQFNPADDNIRKGTSELMVHFNLSATELYGDFWTNHNSKGKLNLIKLSSKHSKSFLEAKKLNA